MLRIVDGLIASGFAGPFHVRSCRRCDSGGHCRSAVLAADRRVSKCLAFAARGGVPTRRCRTSPSRFVSTRLGSGLHAGGGRGLVPSMRVMGT